MATSGEVTFREIYRSLIADSKKIHAEVSGTVGKRSVCGENLKEKVEQAACWIAEQFGVTHRYIGLHACGALEWIILFWAILQSGNKPFLWDLSRKAEENDQALSRLSAVGVIGDGTMPNTTLPCFFRDPLANVEPRSSVSALTFENEVALFGMEDQICLINGETLRIRLRRSVEILQKERSVGKWMLAVPLYSGFGLEWYLRGSLSGASLVFPGEVSVDAVLRTARNHGVTHLAATPEIWHGAARYLEQILDTKEEKVRKKFWRSAEKRRRVSTFRTFQTHLFGEYLHVGLAVGGSVRQKARKMLVTVGYAVYGCLGTAEAGITSVGNDRKETESFGMLIGSPLHGVRYGLEPNGQLNIGGSGIASCLLPEGHSDTLTDRVSTGLAAHADSRGRYWIDGVLSDAVSDEEGSLFYPEQAEQAFDLPQATAWIVLPVEDELTLVVQIPRDLLSMQKKRLLQAVEDGNGTLPESRRISQVRYTYDTLLSACSVGINRKLLRTKIEQGEISFLPAFTLWNTETKEGESEIKKILRRMFADILAVEESDITDDGHFMMDLGGSSLDYFTLVGEINERFHIALGFEADQFSYTLNDFERVIKELIK